MSKTPLFIRLAKPTYGAWIARRHRVSLTGLEHLPHTEGPWLVLSNHVHALDPFFISAVFPKHIRWVAGAHLFKNGFLRTLLTRFVGGISKLQGRSDFQTIKDISTAFKRGDVVGLFPEGTRTWDGEPVGFDEATAKLVRMFKVPVVFLNLEGAYPLKPRWAFKERRGSLIIRILPCLEPESLVEMQLQDISRLLHDRLDFSHRRWAEREQLSYPGIAQAEGAQQLLYLCPDCRATSSIVSRGDRIRCSQCGFEALLDARDRLVPISGKNCPDDIARWHAWERVELESMIASSPAGLQLFPPDRGVLFQIGSGRLHLETVTKNFDLLLSSDSMVVRRLDRQSCFIGASSQFVFPFRDIQSMIINVKSTIELYVDNTLYRVRIDRNSSIVKYLECHLASRNVHMTCKQET